MTLTKQSIQTLRSRGDDPYLQNGFWSIKNTSYLSRDSVDSPATVAIPYELESVETLQFLGLRPEAAQVAFNRFLKQQAEFPQWAEISSAAIGHVLSTRGDAVSETDDWIGVMTRIGLTTEYQTRIMDPNYSHMRLTGSAKHWAIKMIKMRIEFLYNLNNIIKRHGQSPTPKVSHIDGHQMFYKGGCLARLNRIYDENNSLNLGPITSTPPCDFSGFISKLCFTKQENAAWEYADWVRQLVDGAVVPVGILAIAIPDHLLTSTTQVASDSEWRKLVWDSRRLNLDVPLDQFDDFQWITGPVCLQTTEMIKGMSSPAELEVWKLRSGETAIQHFTSSVDMPRKVQKTCEGKVWVTELAWEEANK